MVAEYSTDVGGRAMAAYSIAWSRTAEHAAELKLGLDRMPQGFCAELCQFCKGHGEYKQTYTHGCGGGCYTSIGGCDWCDGTGLMQGSKPAPDSVRNQILIAATR